MNSPDILANTLNLHLSFTREVHDLVKNGYLFLLDSCVNGVHVIKLKHSRNGRCLVLTCSQYSWNMKEKGKVIKEVKPIR